MGSKFRSLCSQSIRTKFNTWNIHYDGCVFLCKMDRTKIKHTNLLEIAQNEIWTPWKFSAIIVQGVQGSTIVVDILATWGPGQLRLNIVHLIQPHNIYQCYLLCDSLATVVLPHEYPVGCHSNNYRQLQPYSLYSIKIWISQIKIYCNCWCSKMASPNPSEPEFTEPLPWRLPVSNLSGSAEGATSHRLLWRELLLWLYQSYSQGWWPLSPLSQSWIPSTHW